MTKKSQRALNKIETAKMDGFICDSGGNLETVQEQEQGQESPAPAVSNPLFEQEAAHVEAAEIAAIEDEIVPIPEPLSVIAVDDDDAEPTLPMAPNLQLSTIDTVVIAEFFNQEDFRGTSVQLCAGESFQDFTIKSFKIKKGASAVLYILDKELHQLDAISCDIDIPRLCNTKLAIARAAKVMHLI